MEELYKELIDLLKKIRKEDCGVDCKNCPFSKNIVDTEEFEDIDIDICDLLSKIYTTINE